jgi:hypothetical protein
MSITAIQSFPGITGEAGISLFIINTNDTVASVTTVGYSYLNNAIKDGLLPVKVNSNNQVGTAAIVNTSDYGPRFYSIQATGVGSAGNCVYSFVA